MITTILLKSRLIDTTVTLSSVGRTSRRADRFEVQGISDTGQILVGKVTTDLNDALSTYNKWKGDPL